MVEALWELREEREGEPAGEAAPSVKASRIRSNLRFFVSIAYDMVRNLGCCLLELIVLVSYAENLRTMDAPFLE